MSRSFLRRFCISTRDSNNIKRSIYHNSSFVNIHFFYPCFMSTSVFLTANLQYIFYQVFESRFDGNVKFLKNVLHCIVFNIIIKFCQSLYIVIETVYKRIITVFSKTKDYFSVTFSFVY